eukprot:gene12700-15931_t
MSLSGGSNELSLRSQTASFPDSAEEKDKGHHDCINERALLAPPFPPRDPFLSLSFDRAEIWKHGRGSNWVERYSQGSFEKIQLRGERPLNRRSRDILRKFRASKAAKLRRSRARRQACAHRRPGPQARAGLPHRYRQLRASAPSGQLPSGGSHRRPEQAATDRSHGTSRPNSDGVVPA